jgi:Dock homology region 2
MLHYRSSLVRLAEKLKKLHRAYIAAHALSFQHRRRSPEYLNEETRETGMGTEGSTEVSIRAKRDKVIRVINLSAGYSKQFLGIEGASREHANLAHPEAVEEAFLEAADVFSPTELPDHRVAWLRKLAQFHATRSKHSEEATCHYMIYHTLYRSARLSGTLWCSTPFLPWIDRNMSDGIHLEGPAGDPDDGSDFEIPELDYGRQIDKTNSFRRIFYRNENSIRLNAGELEAGNGKTAFYGVSLTSEYLTTTPWITLREMEANMLEEAEAAGDLFSKSGIVASSRYMWSLATKYYAEKFMYGKLAHVYERLGRTVVASVPTVDNTLQQEVNVGIPLGRFYRVWFHGGAPDELIGAEYVYRSDANDSIVNFGKELRDVLRCIIPDNTPIHLVLDGRPDENFQPNLSGPRIGGAPLEPVKVKVTPLRPVICNAARIRGLPEWFKVYIDNAFAGENKGRRAFNESGARPTTDDVPHINPAHHHAPSWASASHYSSGNLTSATFASNKSSSNESRYYKFDTDSEEQLVGADKFWFMQPINRERSRASRDWLKIASGDFAEKTLRVTQLQVGQKFPACISRQTVVHRVVYAQSPLEAAVDAICQWCAVLFRTSMACNGMAVLGK